MSTNVNIQPTKHIGTGLLAVAAAGTAQPLTDGVINLNRGSISAATIAFIAATPSVPAQITDTGNGFLTAGFENRDSIRISGSASNDGVYDVQNVAAGTITLEPSESLTAEALGATVNIIRDISPETITVKNVSGTIYVGPIGVSATNGFPLASGESISFLAESLEEVYIDSAGNGDTAAIAIVYNQD